MSIGFQPGHPLLTEFEKLYKVNAEKYVFCEEERESIEIRENLANFAADLAGYTWNILDCCKQLDFCIAMISTYNLESLPPNMGREDYVIYCIENFYLRTTSVLDRSLRLANKFYKIGKHDYQCNFKTIIKEIKNKEALTSMNTFTQTMFSDQRNKIAHLRGYMGSHLEENWDHFFWANEKESDVENPSNELVRKTEAQYQAEFRENLLELKDCVDVYFNELHEVLPKQLEKWGVSTSNMRYVRHQEE